jgi:hypothetical protein
MVNFTSSVNLLLHLSFLLVLNPKAANAAAALPHGFTVGLGPSGVELVWTPNDTPPIRMGGSRPEFRLANTGTVLGYPREMQGKLVLTMSIKEQDVMATKGLEDLQVWVSGRHHESRAAGLATARGAPKAAAIAIVTTPTVDVNPAARGSTATQSTSYTLPTLQLSDSTAFPFPLEVVGEVTQPKTLVPGKKYPLVLFLHGRHATCYQGRRGPFGFDSGDWPCFSGYKPIPSHQGYRYVADILASQGYITVSISANGINGQDYAATDGGASARSILIRHHLALWAEWSTNGGDPWGGNRFKDQLDMDQIVLVGHSRGGEGVHRAAIDASSSDPYKIVGLVTYGPTSFGRQVTPDVHSATILPTCDGDVSDLQGQAYVDASRDIAYSEALRSAVIASGCNHNFFNTEWTPGLSKAPSHDDWFDAYDPVCGSNGGSLRLTPQEQQAVGAAYTIALVRLAVYQDAAMLELLDGSFVRPAAIGRAEVATHAVGGAAYSLLYRPEDNNNKVILGKNGMVGGDCIGHYNPSDNPLLICNRGFFGPLATPRWLRSYYENGHPAPQAVELSWTQAGASAGFKLPIGHRNLTALDWLDVRVASDPNAAGVRLDLLIVDGQGRNVTLPTSLAIIEGWPDPYERVHARALRGSLASVRSSQQINLVNIVAVLLVARSAFGRVWVIDIAASQARIQPPVPLHMPVISVESLFAPEGDGRNTVYVKITADRPLTSPGSIWLSRGESPGYQLDLAAGSSPIVARIPYTILGDDLFGFSTFSQTVTVGALRGVVTGNYRGGIVVVEDEPEPTLFVVANDVTAVEGQPLIWQFRLSAPTTGSFSFFSFQVVEPEKPLELTDHDVPKDWLQQSGILPLAVKPVPLSRYRLFFTVRFGYGETSASLVVPTAQDGTAEDDESVKLMGYNGIQDEYLILTGTVLKHG